MNELKGRVALVTGGAAGIGQSLAIAFARAGAAVAIADVADGAETCRRIESQGGRCRALRCDVSKEDEVMAIVQQAQSALGPIDVLVNNAGIMPVAPLEATSLDLWERVFAVNVRGTFLFSRAVVAGMKQRMHGKILNVSSALFFSGAPALGAYVASKAAIAGLTRALARELGPHNIQVNALAPGMIDTPGVLSLNLPPEATAAFAKAQCIARRETADDLTGAAVLLASSQSDFITGQVLVIDGGAVFH